MRRVVFVSVMLLAFASNLMADPALGAGRGLFRLHDARAEEDGALVFANRWLFRDTILSDGQKYTRGPLLGMEMAYSPYPFVEMNASVLGVMQFQSFDIDYDWQGFGLGGKVSYPYLPVVKAAVSGNWFIDANKNHMFPGLLDDMFPTANYWRGILSFRLWDLHKTLPTIVFNYGGTFDSTPTSLLGLGIELPSDVVDYFVEAVTEAKFSERENFFQSPRQATVAPGVRIKLPYFHLNGGLVFGLKRPWTNQAIAGFTIVSPFPKPKPKPVGQFAGRVEDALTGAPLAARVRYLNRKGEMQTNPSNGTFATNRSPVGALLVEASAEGYRPEVVPISIPDQGIATYTFRLRKAVPTGTLAGRVFDLATNRPLEAILTVDLPDVETKTTDARTGFFRMDDLGIGLTTVKIEREGYFPEERVVEIEEAKVTKLEVGLKAMELNAVFKGRVLDANTGNGLSAVITFVGARQPDLPTNPVNGSFQTELPPGNYNLRITAQNYSPLITQVTIEKGGIQEREYRLTPVPAAAEPPKVDTTKKLVQPTSPGAFMTLKGVLFDFNKAELRPEARPALLEAADVLKQYPDIRVEVQGHTDNVGSDEYNMELSVRRAQAVANFLIRECGIDASRLVVRGYGESRPVASNRTEEGRQQNRRVDFVILK